MNIEEVCLASDNRKCRIGFKNRHISSDDQYFQYIFHSHSHSALYSLIIFAHYQHLHIAIMFNSKLFTYASLLSSSLLVTGSPVHKKREIDVPSDAELYLGGVEPDGNLAINPPITKPEGTVRIMSLGKADTGSPSNGGKNFDQILNVPNANASVGDDSYTFTMTNTLKNPAFTFKLIKRECPNQNISLYRHTNGTYLYNTTFATVVQDVNSAGQVRPSSSRCIE